MASFSRSSPGINIAVCQATMWPDAARFHAGYRPARRGWRSAILNPLRRLSFRFVALAPIQQMRKMRFGSHPQSLRYPCQSHRRLATHSLRDLHRLRIAFGPLLQNGGLERVSFKGSLDAIRQFSNAIDRAPNGKLRRQLGDDLLRTLARDLVPLRPGRREPRAIQRRPQTLSIAQQRARFHVTSLTCQY